jgi:hypothetical protein
MIMVVMIEIEEIVAVILVIEVAIVNLEGHIE